MSCIHFPALQHFQAHSPFLSLTKTSITILQNLKSSLQLSACYPFSIKLPREIQKETKTNVWAHNNTRKSPVHPSRTPENATARTPGYRRSGSSQRLPPPSVTSGLIGDVQKENHKDLFRMSFEYINLATKNFSKENRIGGGGFGGVYRGTLIDEHGKGHRTIVSKRLDKSQGQGQGQGEEQFYNELQILYEYKHDNIIGLLGYSNETDGKMGYVDPMYLKSKILNVESDVYSFGVLLYEILYGKETYKISKPKSESLLDYIKHNFEEGKQEEIVFEYLKKEIMPKSLTTFMKIVQECLAYDREKRPTSKEVLSQLTKALELQDESLQDIGTDSGSHFRC